MTTVCILLASAAITERGSYRQGRPAPTRAGQLERHQDPAAVTAIAAITIVLVIVEREHVVIHQLGGTGLTQNDTSIGYLSKCKIPLEMQGVAKVRDGIDKLHTCAIADNTSQRGRSKGQ